jgi:hypothetical protein
MATKLDETFVDAAKQNHPKAAYYIDTLAEEVRRLENMCEKYEVALLEIATKAPDASSMNLLASRALLNGPWCHQCDGPDTDGGHFPGCNPKLR